MKPIDTSSSPRVDRSPRGTAHTTGRIGKRDAAGPVASALPAATPVGKRCLDVVAAMAGLILLSPLFALIALSIKIFSPDGKVLYRQRRIGRANQPFDMWKFRTMVPGAESLLEHIIRESPRLREQWEVHGKLPHDPRLIPVIGSLLRRTALDELPQLLNVLRGEMSLVGPRPLPEYHLRELPIPFQHERHAVPPGMTGLWQIMGRRDGGHRAFEIYDRWYIERRSPTLDAWILWRTLTIVLRGKGDN